jgi:tRNA pseudouridine55 synthase
MTGMTDPTDRAAPRAAKESSLKTAAHGLLVVNKPVGPTSHDIVAQGRKLFGTRRVGHAGTLDPMASGVLLVLFGEATKLAPYLTADDKRYRATVAFGQATDSGDAQGTVTEEADLTPGWLTADLLGGALAMERARTEQIPPVFSAIKVAGQRSHRLARRGDAPELPPRPVAVRSIDVIHMDAERVVLELCVSKGYYVRSLARDLGARLGVPSHLTALERTASGVFGIDEACPWPTTSVLPLVPLLEAAARALPAALLTPSGFDKASKGQRLDHADFATPPPEGDQPCAWVFDDQLIAVGGKADGRFVVRRGFTLGC